MINTHSLSISRLPVKRIVTALLFALIASGCGYGFQGGGSVLPPEVKRVYVPMVDNLSTETGLTLIVTEAMRDRFERFGVLSVVDTQSAADAILKLAILSVKRDTSATASGTNTQLKQNAVITLAGELKKTSGEILWRSTGFSVTRPFGTTANVVVTSSPDFAATGLGAGDLASLGNREISRGAERATFELLAIDAATKVYDEAVSPDF